MQELASKRYASFSTRNSSLENARAALRKVVGEKNISLNEKVDGEKLKEAKVEIQKNRKFWISSWEENVVPLMSRLMSDV